MKRSCQLASAIVLFCASQTAAQPLSKSMADCAGLSAVARDIMTRMHVQNRPAIDQLEFAQAKWINAAVRQAQMEGIEDPDSYVQAAMQATYMDWQDRGSMAVFGEDFNEWMDYCRALARDRGITLSSN